MRRNMLRRPRRGTQLPLNFSGRVYRKKPGRPRSAHPRVPHTKRPPVPRRLPVHFDVRLDTRGRNLRTYDVLRCVRQVLYALHGARPSFRVVHYSIQHNHLHGVAEADSPGAFGSGARSFCIRLAKRLNRTLGRKGRLFADRHYRRVLRTPLETRHVLAYVLLNRRRHLANLGCWPGAPRPDPYSSGRWFDGWREPTPRVTGPPEVRPALGWLVTTGWRKFGPISLQEVPGRP